MMKQSREKLPSKTKYFVLVERTSGKGHMQRNTTPLNSLGKDEQEANAVLIKVQTKPTSLNPN